MVKYSNWHYNKRSTIVNYDSCRFIDNSVILKIVGVIIELSKEKYNRVKTVNIFDAGCGNGRVLIPLTLRTKKDKVPFRIIGGDLSILMLKDLRKKPYAEKCTVVNMDLQDPWPFSVNSFDIIFQFACFHILERWKDAIDNLINCLSNNGSFVYLKEINQVFHGTENRIFPKDLREKDLNPAIREFFIEYHKLRKEYGVEYISSGIEYSDITNLENYLDSKGLERRKITSSELSWQKPHSFREMITAFREGNITTFGSDISEKIRIKMSDRLMIWCKEKMIDLNTITLVPARIEIYEFAKL